MKTLKAIFTHRWIIALLCFIALGVLIHYFGPLFAFGESRPLASAEARWTTLGLLLVTWLAYELFSWLKRKNAELHFLDRLLDKEVPQDISADEIATLKSRFEAAIKTLRQSSRKFGRPFSLYEVPWYIIIGPPGSGKTTALINSGLKFPLADADQASGIAGIGGTRNCDWWFTDQAVLIDTAGRYTTQDSQREQDKGAWLGFLKLLKQFRKRQPINGALVAISISDLLLQNRQQREQHILSISQRLQELRDNLDIDFPVYVLLTKCDLVAGFDEFFDNYSQNERQQLWGITLPPGASGTIVSSTLQSGFKDLIQRLNYLLLARMHNERDQQRAQKIFAFPKQLQQAEPVVVEFVSAIFDVSRYNKPLQLRGLYLTSGTQEGTPIDRLLNRLGAGRSSVGGKGKSFFLHDVFTRVMFAESGLAGIDQGLERRLRWLNTGLSLGFLAVTTVGLLSLSWSYFNNQRLIHLIETQLSQAEAILEAQSEQDADPVALLPLLNLLRDVPGGYASQQGQESFWGYGFGLNQVDTLGEQARLAYQRLLNRGLLARLMRETEHRLRDTSLDSSYRYAALRVYLMLASDERFQGDEVNTFYQYDWLGRNQRTLTDAQIQDLIGHLNALFDQRPSPLPMDLDGGLIREVRASLDTISPVATVLGRMEQMPLEGLSPYSIYEQAGKQLAEQVFVRRSGASLSDGIPALYTKAAYDKLQGGELDTLVEEVLAESWIFGETAPRNTLPKDQLIADVKKAYLERYGQLYYELIGDIQLAPFSNFNEGAQILNILSGESSPLQLLLMSLEQQTNLAPAKSKVPAAAEGSLQQARNKLQRILGSSVESVMPAKPADDVVTTQFAPLNQLVTKAGEGAPLPIQTILKQLAELYQFMAKIAIESNGAGIDPATAKAGEEASLRTRLLADTQSPLLIRPLLNDAAQRMGGLASGSMLRFVNEQWRQEAYPSCLGAIHDRYPFNPRSSSDVALGDFAEFFGYDGTMDKFFKTHLANHIDTSSSPWRIATKSRGQITISGEALRAFEQADRIRRAFFAKGGKQIFSEFRLTPFQMDNTLSGFYLTMDNQSASYEFGPLLATPLTWPGSNPGAGARINLRTLEGKDLAISTQGDWAWFRLLDRMQMTRGTTPERFKLRFEVSGFSADYELIAAGVNNPYRLRGQMAFTCPSSL